MSDFEKQKAAALRAVRLARCVGSFVQVPVQHITTITTLLAPIAPKTIKSKKKEKK